jgi:hypothetical protein
MGLPFNGDLVPVSSGFANLGVDVDSNAQNAFDATDNAIRPFNHIHQVSGVFHDPLHGQSGVLRYNQQLDCFEISTDGGITFGCLAITQNVVSSIGVLGDVNLTGDVDLASPVSGFIAIFDTSDVSPIQFAVDQLGLSGLWDFPSQGFNGRVVNELIDFHGTTVQGSVTIQGVSGILVDIVGQTVNIGPAQGNGFAACYSQDFDTAAVTWVVNHNLDTDVVQVQAFNAGETPKAFLLPDRIVVLDRNTVRITFNTAQSGEAVVLACPNIP